MSLDVQNTSNSGQDFVSQTSSSMQQEASSKELNFEKLRRKVDHLTNALQERDSQLLRQQQVLENLNSRFSPVQEDSLESMASTEIIDKETLTKFLHKERVKLLEEAEKKARQTYEKIEKENFASRLQNRYPDYEDVVNEENANKLQEEDPEFIAALEKIEDPYSKRELAYKKLKKISQKHANASSRAQDIVDANARSASIFGAGYGHHQGTASPSGFDFDARDPEARRRAYEKLKSAARRVSF